MTEPANTDRQLLTSLFAAAVTAADPRAGIARHLPERPKGRTIVLGIGKASVPMGRALVQLWDGPLQGLIVTRKGSAADVTGGKIGPLAVLESSHPIPDAASLLAGQRMQSLVSSLTHDDLVIALVSGGGSALVTLPAPPLSLTDKQAVNRVLLASGMPIRDMNCIRKHLSAVKGGRLAAHAFPARVVSLVISDIPGDDAALVASGPTIPDPRGLTDARELVKLFKLELPPAAAAMLASESAIAPNPVDPAFVRNTVHVIASNKLSLEAAAGAAALQNLPTHILSDAIEGEAEEIAKMHAAIAREIARAGRPFAKPALLLSGGETTVTVRNPEGRGGRNTAFLLSFALGIEGALAIEGVAHSGCKGITVLAADTDGIDGTEQNAGAFADGTTVARLRQKNLDPRALLRQNNAYAAFEALDDLFIPGPTGTNVNDFRAILVR